MAKLQPLKSRPLARHCGLPLILSWILFSSTAVADLPDSLTIGGQAVSLNGAGTRKKTFVSIYESGLYLQSPSTQAREILDADELMAIRVRILSSFVSRASLLASLEEGLKKSTQGNSQEIARETELFLNSLKKEVKKNDIYDFVYVPQQGLVVLRNGRVQGTVPGLAFKRALFGIWLSDQPVDTALRSAMLSSTGQR